MSTTRSARSTAASVALSYVLFVFVGVSAAVGGVLLPAQIRDYDVDMATIGLTFFTSSAGFFLAGSSTGALVHRLGTRWSLVGGGVLYVLAAVATAARPSFVVFVLVQAVAGYGVGVLESVLNAYLSQLPSATTLLNRLHAFFGVGALLGPALAARLLETMEWTAVWWVLAALAVPLVVAVAVVFPRAAARPGAATTEPDDAPQHRPGLLLAVLRERAVLLAAVFLTVYLGVEISVGTWAFTDLVERHAAPELAAGYAVSAYWSGLTLGRFVLSPLATRLGLGVGQLVGGCLGAVLGAVAVVWLAPTAALATVGLTLLGFFLGPLFPTAIAVVPRLTTAAHVPTAIGAMNAVSVVGGSALPWLGGALAGGVGIEALLPYVLALAVVQALVWRGVARRMAPA
ncbi:MFS transporter [Actinotalea ferrariae]|uniref:MFS transporter n=1 Tax=Actinotalea ferrariae TaxID=1386098 RepID=UPI001C8CE93A|nr:MFS transporter [Actinotalea ferrariae]MBX9244056.1 MFS transporter [Actinotalea ferrariae]